MDMLLSDSEWENFSESGISEEQEEMNFLYDGQASTILSSLEESIGKIDDLLSFERGFVHGDIVRSVTDPSGQMGRVINVNMLVDLENVHGNIIKDVNSKQLLKIRSISVGDYVVNSTWIGKVDKVVDRVTFVFDDGSKCEVSTMDQVKLVPVSPNIIDDLQYPYYPGQRVRVVPSNFSSSTRWLCGTWSGNQDEGTVSGVDVGFVYVNWISSAHMDHDSSASPPSRLQEAKDLTLLSSFPHASWQLGDWCMLSFDDCNGTFEEFLHGSTRDVIKDNWRLEKGFKRGNLGSRLEEIFAIMKTKTKLDVMWQDGTCSLGLESHTLLPVSVANAHEFWPCQFILEKGTSVNNQRWGVVHGVDAKERMVKVQWRNMDVNEVNNYDTEQMEETVSAYELVEHPNYCYSFGDIVFKVVQNHFGDQADNGHVTSETGFGTEAAPKGENMRWNQNNSPSSYGLSCIGTVIGFEDGELEVKWASGISTKVAPYEIYRIDKCEDSVTAHVHYEENTEDFNHEMFLHETLSDSPKGKELLSFDSARESGEKVSWAPTSFFRPQAAIRFFSTIASSILGSLGSRSPLSQESSSYISHGAREYDILLEKEELETCYRNAELDLIEMQISETTKIKQEVEEIKGNNGRMMPRPNETSGLFRQFDMVSECTDHHFLGENKVLAVSQVKRSWVKKVQQEWSILEENLPETIYVRAYEERMDLLRAALVGAPGTPYHDGLFFFDIYLHPEYPYEPPSVYYHSGGLRLNPNLYESGKVCLSLLNTWTGSDTEVWNPGSSTILQVLLSLQALVLNEKPYFNEAGYDKQLGRAEGETNSVSYNENAFLVTWQSMLYILRKPPQHFEALVKEHFSKHAEAIIWACNMYMEGARVGYALECRANSRDEHIEGSSTGFKIMLPKLLPKLVEAFSDQGIDCSRFQGLK
ncbi:putative ubiquitin-conjugating enzyme E2 24 [Hibiscus syriacus]|uniref:E2 ubiquitin-conjugating enzyme n=1 Tax=Hibiscus syriacus TaxID=106335 RepID=A0A6A3BVE3_HIBSY|nr:probable ubiquitin-conjugating enzyme E2 24 [Hibiscus syriacus]XP_039065148.1 probable ubiquitin-conjugating enzyme E2 24 [Hibiscus syriacus]KAE8719927.1 putative ubiquitin-conjugating enzyme E2 24 [Hibiscus syriacus]